MADAIPYTPGRALQIPRTPVSTTRPLPVLTAFDGLLGALAALLRVEEAFSARSAAGSAMHVDLDATSHGYAGLDGAAQAVLALAPAGQADRALQTGALLVRLAIGMEDPQDRAGVCQMIDEARARLMLDAGSYAAAAGEARSVNLRLALAFRRLDRLVELEAEACKEVDESFEDDGFSPVL
jgi:hypothetical protein